MVITQITKNEIFCYHDYEFMIFDRHALSCGINCVGVVWAGGKSGNGKTPLDVKPHKIPRGSSYHIILTITLIRIVEREMNKIIS